MKKEDLCFIEGNSYCTMRQIEAVIVDEWLTQNGIEHQILNGMIGEIPDGEHQYCLDSKGREKYEGAFCIISHIDYDCMKLLAMDLCEENFGRRVTSIP